MIVSDDVCGFDCLGADETSTDKAVSFIKTAGPGLISAITDVASKKKPDEKKSDEKKYPHEGFWSSLSTLGKVGVVLGGLVGVTGLGFAVRAIARR